MKTIQRQVGYGLVFSLMMIFACNSPMKSKQEMNNGSDQQSDNGEAGGTAGGAAPLGGNAAVGAGGAGGQAAGTSGGPTPGVTGGGSSAVSPAMRDAGHKYSVTQKGDGGARTLIFAAMNLKTDTTRGIADSTYVKDVKGDLEKTQLIDANNDHNPDIICFTRSQGTQDDEQAGSVYGVTYINNKGIPILPGEAEKSDLPGYRGRDSFYVQPPYIIRSYQSYKPGDPSGAPTGGKQTVKYTLEKRAGGYMLKQVK